MTYYSATIIGIREINLSKEERMFLKNNNPLGVILFRRNIDNPDQLKHLIKDIKDCLGRDSPILIDQEGGAVARLVSPHFSEYPPAKYFGDIATNDINKAISLLELNYFDLGCELKNLGINFNCAPVLDLYIKTANQVIGDRSFSSDPKIVSILAEKACMALKKAGIIPIIKHIPGHGRANVDSHLSLPIISTDTNDYKNDLKPFKYLNDMPVAMTAHIVLKGLDSKAVTQSKIIINKVIRKEIGFNGLLISDDICMKALEGDVYNRAYDTRQAGCDIVLHCDGNINDAQKAIDGAGKMDKSGLNKLTKSYLWLNT